MHAGLSFSYPPISLLLRQPLSIKKSYAGAIQLSNTSFLFNQLEFVYLFFPKLLEDSIPIRFFRDIVPLKAGRAC
jgi:hypothetical protein